MIAKFLFAVPTLRLTPLPATPACLSYPAHRIAPFLPAVDLFAPIATAVTAAQRTVKVLNLLTNRYHVGVIRSRNGTALQVELPTTARLEVGQRVRFVVADDQPLVARNHMHTARVTRVAGAGRHLQVDMLPQGELALT